MVSVSLVVLCIENRKRLVWGQSISLSLYLSGAVFTSLEPPELGQVINLWCMWRGAKYREFLCSILIGSQPSTNSVFQHSTGSQIGFINSIFPFKLWMDHSYTSLGTIFYPDTWTWALLFFRLNPRFHPRNQWRSDHRARFTMGRKAHWQFTTS